MLPKIISRKIIFIDTIRYYTLVKVIYEDETVEYRAGCRYFTKEQALDHWNPQTHHNPKIASQYVDAILNELPVIIPNTCEYLVLSLGELTSDIKIPKSVKHIDLFSRATIAPDVKLPPTILGMSIDNYSPIPNIEFPVGMHLVIYNILHYARNLPTEQLAALPSHIKVTIRD